MVQWDKSERWRGGEVKNEGKRKIKREEERERESVCVSVLVFVKALTHSLKRWKTAIFRPYWFKAVVQLSV